MNIEKPHPPALAVWLLRRFYPERYRDALIGDLLERFGEGRSDAWFWRQVVVAVLVGSPWFADIWVAVLGTGLIWCVPWSDLIPMAEKTTWLNWGAQARSLFVIEITTALVVLPVFTWRLHRAQALGWRSVLTVFTISTPLFAAGDLLTLCLSGSHSTIGDSNARWLVLLQLAWIFTTLLFSAGLARRLPPSPKQSRSEDSALT
jgi:hypothetical protein